MLANILSLRFTKDFSNNLLFSRDVKNIRVSENGGGRGCLHREKQIKICLSLLLHGGMFVAFTSPATTTTTRQFGVATTLS